jgi:2-polyprenyl-3-methyl-5-hydroxy-6-metoxy-1,4-benzoquinol methylase
MSVSEFPASFDTDIYKVKNSDLHTMSNSELIAHYTQYGKQEGRICSEINSRNSLLSYIKKEQKCLEIGPFDCPVLTGSNVQYFDVLCQEDLKIRAININRTCNINSIPYIDYVSNTGDLSIIKETFDIILSCHSIEHQINLIGHLNNVSKLLSPNGFYIIICPNKNYCFDHFIKETTIADILQMNEQTSKRHTLKSVIEHRILTCHNDASRHWANDHGNQAIDNNSELLTLAVNEYNSTDEYIDVHSLQFTPASFEMNINLLTKNKYIDLKIHRVYQSVYGSNEFYAILQK